MNLAIATDFYSPWIGGPARFIDNFCGYLLRSTSTHHVEVIAPSVGGAPSRERHEGVIVHRLPTAPLPFGHQLRVTYRLDAARDALLAARPDVVQVHHPFPLCAGVLRAAGRAGVPVVAVNHTIPACSLYGIRQVPVLYPLVTAAFQRYVMHFLGQADAVCTPTATAAALLREMGFRRPIAVISNGIDTARFTPDGDKAAARAEFGLPNKPIVLYTGRLDPEKEMPVWIHAAARALRDVEAHLVIGGEGTHRPVLETLVRQLGIESWVTFPGYVPFDRLPRLYQAADVYFMASTVELQSISTLEALASGLPVVAAAAGALPELVHNGENGFLVAPGDVKAFAAALCTVLSRGAGTLNG